MTVPAGPAGPSGLAHPGASRASMVLASLAATLLGTTLLASTVTPATADDGPPPNDNIIAYATEAEIHPDGMVSISESITYDFGSVPSPGISREIPLTLDNEGVLRERRVEIDDVEVSSPTGADTTIDGIEGRDGNLVILVGAEDDPGTDVTGEQTYVISYTVSGALTAFDGYDELYWNFVGTEWTVPIENVSVEVTAPEIVNVDCYAGYGNSQDPCESAEHDDTVASFTQSSLRRVQGLTVAVTLPPGAVEVGEPIYALRSELTPPPLALIAIGVAAIVILCAAIYRRHRRATISAYPPELPTGLTPGVAAMVVEWGGALAPRTLLVMLVDLEQRGVVSSAPNPDRPGDWLFTLEVSPHDANFAALSPAEHELLKCTFRYGWTADLSQLATQMNPTTGKAIQTAVREEGKRLNLWFPSRWRGGLLVLAGCIVLGFLSYFAMTRGVEGAGTAAVAMFVTAVVAGSLMGVTSLTPYGAHVRQLLATARTDTEIGGPRSMAQYPAWAVAIGVPNEAVADAAALLPQNQVDRHSVYYTPYYADSQFHQRWNSSLKSRITPQSSSSGGGGSGSGSFGGGSVGGGGGGGGGGRR